MFVFVSYLSPTLFFPLFLVHTTSHGGRCQGYGDEVDFCCCFLCLCVSLFFVLFFYALPHSSLALVFHGVYFFMAFVFGVTVARF